MVLPSVGLGEGASLNFGADGGPIHSSDTFENSFNTGPFGTKGASTIQGVTYMVAGAAIAGVAIWLLYRLSR